MVRVVSAKNDKSVIVSDWLSVWKDGDFSYRPQLKVRETLKEVRRLPRKCRRYWDMFGAKENRVKWSHLDTKI